jgi:DNA-binding NarL/FixJ family response regulator
VAVVWPLVGRGEELDFIHAVVARGSDGVVVAGAAGVGKSRLLAELVDRLTVDGKRVVMCVGSRSARAVPFGALAPLLTVLEIEDHVIHLPGVLQAAQACHGLVLAVDDAHNLDGVSATLVNQLARLPDVTVLAAMRNGERAPDAIDALWKDEILVRIELQPLSRTEVGALLVDSLDGSVSETAANRLYETSAGNVLMLREVVLDALESGDLERRDGLWCWSGRVRGGARLTALISHRVDRLSDAERRLIEFIALLDPLPLLIAEELVGRDVIASCAKSDVIVIDETERGLRLLHPLYDGVVWAGLPFLTRQTRLSELETAIAAVDPDPPPAQVVRLAVLHTDLGEPAPAELLARGARIASDRADPVLAERLALAAIATDPTSFDTRLTLAQALGSQSRHEEANVVLATLEGSEPDEMAIATLAYYRMMNLTFMPADGRRDAATVLDRAALRIGAPAAAAFVTASKAEYAYNQRDLATAIALTETLVSTEDLDSAMRMRAVHIGALANMSAGFPDRAMAMYEQIGGLPAAVLSDNPRADAWATFDPVMALVYAGRLDDAEALCQPHRLERSERVTSLWAGELHHHRGRIELLRGRPRTASDSLRQAVVECRDLDYAGYLTWTLGLLAAARSLVGDQSEADALLTEAATLSERSPRRLVEGDRRLAAAWVLAGRGELSASRRLAATLGIAAADHGMISWATIALHDAVRLGDRTVSERLIDVARRFESPLADAMASHAAALVAHDGAGLVAAASQLVTLGLLLDGAEAYAQAAVELRAAGQRVAARSASARAVALVGQCEGARTPALATAGLAELKLTKRELEVIVLAARGASNRDIADSLYVSERTVEGHLLRAFTKLGITRRTELSAFSELGTSSVI